MRRINSNDERIKVRKKNISQLTPNFTLENYQKFLEVYFKHIDDEDRHDIVAFKTPAKFRVIYSFIDVLQLWKYSEGEMKKCKKYCLHKSATIYNFFKKGKIPQREGPNENIDQLEDLGPGKEISELIDNLNFEKNNNNIIIKENNKSESKLFNNNENVELKI